MNKHIELVKKWLADNDSVTQQELENNRDEAWSRVVTKAFADGAIVYNATAYAAAAANGAYNTNAAYWVKRYEELKEQGE
jgi:hypothetical protein